jgi:hypothetical protein
LCWKLVTNMRNQDLDHHMPCDGATVSVLSPFYSNYAIIKLGMYKVPALSLPNRVVPAVYPLASANTSIVFHFFVCVILIKLVLVVLFILIRANHHI